MELHTLLGTLAALIVCAGYVPYLRDVFARRVQPHIYTWVIWTITQTTGAIGMWYGGGASASWGLIAGAVLVGCTAVASIWYGTHNITRGDTLGLAAAVCMIALWWYTESVLLATLLAALIDGVGYLITIRKTWEEPHSEQPLFWALMSLATLCVLFSSPVLNVYTIPYTATLFVGNIAVLAISTYKK